VTGLRSTLGRLIGGAAAEITGAPPAEFSVAPSEAEQLGRLLAFASEHGLTVLPWGSGTHQGFGGRVSPDIVVATSGFGGIRVWEPDDLTVVVGAGCTTADLADRLAERRQSALLAESDGVATVGGVVAAGLSGWRRLRYGPTRDRVLQVEVVTGDGRIVRAGAPLVKNVTGYDLPKLYVGSLGSLGVITSVCFKLWPEPEQMVTVAVADPERALRTAYRPQAVLSTPQGAFVYLGGTAAEVERQAGALDGDARPGFEWPEFPGGPIRIRVRVPPAATAEAVSRLGGFEYVAAHGVGEVVAALESGEIADLRSWAESVGGTVVIERAPDEMYASIDPWGSAPGSLAVQRRVKAAFDPDGIMVPGRLPGGV
jgi:glycolate oxidase FAD binding subunit